MKIHYCANYDQMSQLAFIKVISDLKKNPKQLMCVATGNSPIGIYGKLADSHRNDPGNFKKLTIVKLDEWGGISSDDPNSCETFIQQKLLQPLNISEDRYISFKSNPGSPEDECKRIENELQQSGSIDICILGLGINGHIGFNEPTDSLNPFVHVAQLSKDSLQHQMIQFMDNKPKYGLTLGMSSIIQSKKIILIISGLNKKNIINKLLSGRITTQLPATFLWLHPNVECYIDLNSLK